jgi:hypothetical protein
VESNFLSRNVFWSRIPGKFINKYTGVSFFDVLGGDEVMWTHTLLSVIEDESCFLSEAKGIPPDKSFLESNSINNSATEVISYDNLIDKIKIGEKVYNLLKNVLKLVEKSENNIFYFQYKNSRLILDKIIDPGSIILEEDNIGKIIINVIDLA